MKRIIILTICILMLLTLTSCGRFLYEWEVDTHKEFVENIDKYNSANNGTIDTFVSFDLDSNDQVTQSKYYASSMVSPASHSFRRSHGCIYDMHDEGLGIRQLYYLKSEDGNEYAYKINCNFKRVDFNFTADDNIEIIASECTNYYYSRYDLIYEDTLSVERNSENIVSLYNHTYHYSLCVDGEEICCIHISSTDELNNIELEEIKQMLMNSLVVINTDVLFIWRDKK